MMTQKELNEKILKVIEHNKQAIKELNEANFELAKMLKEE